MTNNPTLQLLVIDLGDICVIKVEKGNGEPLPMLDGNRLLGFKHTSTVVTDVTFSELREAIDGDKPVPRLERGVDVDGNHVRVIGTFDVTQFGYYAYEVLCEIAGKRLPIYNGGTWEQLNEAKRERSGLSVWRYTR